MAATVLSGDAFGEKALFSDRRLIWRSAENGFFAVHEKEAGQADTTGLVVIGGQKVYCELLGQEKKIVVCGGGHVSIQVIQMGRMIGCQVTVLEDRPEFADHARAAGASRVICAPFAEGLEEVPGDADTFFVIVTRGHRHDQSCLEAIAKKKHAYIGMIGSRKRTALVKEAVIANGADPAVISRVYTPIGLSIGAETPEEIAIAILAEIISVKNQNKPCGGYPKEIMQEIRSGVMAGERKVLAVVVDRTGSAPRGVGTKMLVLPAGRCIGTIGGGCAEAEICRRALGMLQSRIHTPELCRIDLAAETAGEEGMVCGGVMDILLELV